MPDLNKVQEKLNTFTDDFQSLVISSITDEHEPFASYAPFVKHNNHYYFIISKIAKHYLNMLQHPIISIFFLEDEQKAVNVFFRRRLSYLVKTTFDTEAEVKDAFSQKFGEFVNRLFLMDFVMVKCEIISGHFVIGAGQAYDIDAHEKVANQMTGNSGKGHQKA